MRDTKLEADAMRASVRWWRRARCRGVAGWTSTTALAVLLVGAAVCAVAAEGGGVVDLSTATTTELAALPGIGPAKAEAIVAHRQATPFRSVDDLAQVKGIGDKLLEQLRGRLTVSASGSASLAAQSGAQAETKASRQGTRAAQGRPGS